ncbi:MAG: tRNA guanosine(34) transglycosylase Tgt, partial [Patescibacteria group bacterium]
MAISFKIQKKSKTTAGRRGVIHTRHGDIATPAFMTIATKAAVKSLGADDLAALAPDIVLSNTYHLWRQPGHELIKQAGGLHQFMQWPKPILTDSGGYQVFSLAQHRQLTEAGVEFKDPKTGERCFLSPEKAIDIQTALGVDLMMVLDECPPYPCPKKYAEDSLALTTRWAARCQDQWQKQPAAARWGRGLFGIVQGSVHQKLREQSAQEITA